jgi:hypothetical protein
MCAHDVEVGLLRVMHCKQSASPGVHYSPTLWVAGSCKLLLLVTYTSTTV